MLSFVPQPNLQRILSQSQDFRNDVKLKKLIKMKVKELIKLIEQDGWTQIRMRGSHRQFRHPGKAGLVTIAGKPSADMPPGTLASVLKQAGLKKQED